mmetsp:Transcript_28875/g.54507  ORF Transcript_28875/g.54507 Transcript_28875/m.54507 type:complete len:272 (-) Transcript_28875:160-975(-)|eukprot:CAMPEP_0182496768 /NCGR_PEP_ID=MMETSP1321-20130603/5360_1 /TAXON_ID=91990 /ORGANISM="Bolidomonas sp., Strain RCC1657" /LENGTH=271 /DNA_ID=CAMNT_0024700455 /DNA_START=232 /DNA_END=1047 /DNA_ORIENTATION=+
MSSPPSKVPASGSDLGLPNTPATTLSEHVFPAQNHHHAHHQHQHTKVPNSPPPTVSVNGGSRTSSPVLSSSSSDYVGASEARQGRSNQRYDVDIRLVVGSVCIVRDGRILLISASKKKEWILPKGGWENDETVEEGVQRETYEEAGIYGTLGEPLTPMTYETRKSKLKKASSNVDVDSSCELTTDVLSSALSSSTPAVISTATTPAKTATVCRGYFYPLYVSEVLDKWPEDGRHRQIVSIDEAIKAVVRPELKLVLQEVKDKKLHLVGPCK